jgi:para-nitrobenzyl esterase
MPITTARRSFAPCLLGAALLTTLVACGRPESPPQLPHPPETQSQRDTAQGAVIGFADADDTYGWMGIPFAAAPVGELRWRAPQPPASRGEVLRATAPRAPCVQPSSRLAGVPERPGQAIGAEDCLYLNIWAPRRTPAEGLPVMVWIHGGGNTLGTANTYTSFSELAGPQQVVVVALNYRLGVLGWFRHPALRSGDADSDSGNFGTLDLIAGLQWVRDNIEAFGGDPRRVTLFGESAGGVNIFALLAAPQARGLFHGAIVQSGLPTSWTTAQTEARGELSRHGAPVASRDLVDQLLLRAGRAADLAAARELQDGMAPQALREFLHGVDAQALLAPVLPPESAFPLYTWPANIADGSVLPARPLLALMDEPGAIADVPLILGTNRDEMRLFMMGDPDYVKMWFGRIPRIRDEARYLRDTGYASEMWRAVGAEEPARLLAGTRESGVYTYRFDWDALRRNWLVDMPTLIGAAHAMELGFVVGASTDMAAQFGVDEADVDDKRQLAAAMRSYWAQFAHGGDPGRGRDGALPAWSPRRQASASLLFDAPADGGIRMEDVSTSVAAIKRRLLGDATIADRCASYAQLFYGLFSQAVAWNPDEYRQLGCDGVDPAVHAWR